MGKTFTNMLMFCLIIWGSPFFQYQNSITKGWEIQQNYVELYIIPARTDAVRHSG